MTVTITLLPGDGIGPEVISSAVKVLNLAAERFGINLKLDEKFIGGISYDKFGTPITEDTLRACYDSDAVLLGAVGGHKWEELEHNSKPEAALLKLRKSLGLYANLRPAKVYSSLVDSSSLKSGILEGTNLLVLRELTGGIYFGDPRGYNENRGWNTMIYTMEEVSRIARRGFEIARLRNKKVTNVDKANVLECSQFWRKIVHEIHKDYSDIELSDMYVDNAAMQIVRDPKQFDVILTSNLFGDILSDIAGMITGSLGMLPSASLGNNYALYEPVHGSAPDIAGQNKANPIAAISSVAMLFEHSLKIPKASALIDSAVERTLMEGYRTEDIHSKGSKLVTTTGMTERIISNFESLYHEEALKVITL